MAQHDIYITEKIYLPFYPQNEKKNCYKGKGKINLERII